MCKYCYTSVDSHLMTSSPRRAGAATELFKWMKLNEPFFYDGDYKTNKKKKIKEMKIKEISKWIHKSKNHYHIKFTRWRSNFYSLLRM